MEKKNENTTANAPKENFEDIQSDRKRKKEDYRLISEHQKIFPKKDFNIYTTLTDIEDSENLREKSNTSYILYQNNSFHSEINYNKYSLLNDFEPIGFENFGNTCYMYYLLLIFYIISILFLFKILHRNSTIQALINSPVIIELLEQYRDELIKIGARKRHSLSLFWNVYIHKNDPKQINKHMKIFFENFISENNDFADQRSGKDAKLFYMIFINLLISFLEVFKLF